MAQATPTITWASPASIVYGTALSAIQLDATANVPGTFAYSLAAGTVLGAGSQTLSVTFTPTDTTDYKTATAETTIVVAQATPTITWAGTREHRVWDGADARRSWTRRRASPGPSPTRRPRAPCWGPDLKPSR